MKLIDQPVLKPDNQVRRLRRPFEPVEARVDGDALNENVNVADGERWLSLLAGSALIVAGMRRRHAGSTAALSTIGGYLLYRGVAGRCHLYDALGVNRAREGRAEPRDFFERGIHVAKAVTINAPPEDLYRFWRQLDNLPLIMSHLKSVTVIDERKSHWQAAGPLNSTFEWDAEIINDDPNERISWKSLPGADVDHAGSVRFVRAPADRGTQVRVELEYIPTVGKVGAAIARLFGEDPNGSIKEDLRQFKARMEAGGIPSNEGQPRGACVGAHRASVLSGNEVRS